MGLASILGGEEIAESAFKRSADGWVFKTPPLRRLFGLGACYKLDDAKKAEIKRLYVKYWRGCMLAVIPIVAVLMGLRARYPGVANGYDLAIAVVLGGVVGPAGLAIYCAELKKRLTGVTPTTDRLSLGEQYLIAARETPLWRALVFEAFSVIMVVTAFAPQPEPLLSPLFRNVAFVLFVLCAVYYAYVIVLKLADRIRRA